MSDIEKLNSINQTRTEMEFYNPKRNEIYDRFDEFVNIVFVQGKQINWVESVNKGVLVRSDNDFKELLGEEGKKVYAPLLEKVKKGKNVEEKEKWMSEYPSNQDENGDWAQDKGKNKWAVAVEKNANLRKLLDHLTYIWSLTPVMRTRLYENGDKEKNTVAAFKASKEIFPETGLWARGQGSSQKPDDFYTLVLLMESINKRRQEEAFNDVKAVLDYIINYFTGGEYKDKNPPIKNAFLHLCDAGKYAPVAVKSTKDEIKRNLKFVLSEDDQKKLKDQTTDDWVLAIHQKLKAMVYPEKKGSVFFEPNVRIFVNNKDDGVSDYSVLKFKKAAVLYGPPGTSKTYTAIELAKAILFEHYSKEFKEAKTPEEKNSVQENIKKIFQNEKIEQIHRFQLHSNYSYEDFIWGYEIANDEINKVSVSKPKKGRFLKLLDEIKNDSCPHILILDEINRVDLSRLFGELFSAIENRGEKNKISLSVKFEDGDDSFWIPDNLYIIGTMNEIDFSLERVDFALRRRFAWIFKGYDEDVLKKIISEKDDQNQDYDDYFAACSALNKAIDKDKESRLGEQYEIGHTIFADIAGIRKDVDNNLKLAKKILWNISIKPLLEAYLGNLEEDELKNKLNAFAVKFGIKNSKTENGDDSETIKNDEN